MLWLMQCTKNQLSATPASMLRSAGCDKAQTNKGSTVQNATAHSITHMSGCLHNQVRHALECVITHHQMTYPACGSAGSTARQKS
jgi:hypothetical protein